MSTEDKNAAAKGTDAQGKFLSGSISEEFLDAESLRRGFAMALGVDPTIGTSQSSCHFARALLDAGILNINRGAQATSK
jgi:hypothetical protein